MFNIFKSSPDDRPGDVKSLREALLRFIKEQLQKLEGEGGNVRGLQLYIIASPQDKHLYEAALNADQAERFKNEIKRIADDYALNLPENWTLEISYEQQLPPEAAKAPRLPVGLFIRTKQQAIQKTETAYIRVLNGKAEKDEYVISSTDPKLNIGRERQVQVKDGYFRKNQIAFPGDIDNECNKYISRQHAHIEWDNDHACFMLYADEGGVPPGNKVKIRKADEEELIKLHSTHIGHRLREGDQVILGDSAVIEFSYKPAEA